MKHALPLRRLSLPWSALAAVLLAGFITLLALWCQPNAFRSVISIFLHKPVLIVLNALPVGLLVLLFGFLFRNVFLGAALVNFMVCALSIANRVKIEVRDEPVFPRDFALLKEVFSAVGNYRISYPVKAIAVVVVVTILLAAAGTLVGSKPFPLDKLRGWRGSLLGAAGSLALLALLTVTLLGSSKLYESIGCSNPYRLSTVFNETGFPYSFFHQFTTYLVDKPEGYKKSEAAGWETGETSGLGKDVHVVMVMNEAFSGITDDPAFTYSPEDDPLKNLHALQERDHTLSGRLVVPSYAGGTANTEFDVLTGMQTTALSATTTSAMRVVNRNLDSLFRVFRADGYHTSFLHPGDDWFYNRENVYRWFGAEETMFIDQMDQQYGSWLEEVKYKGRWVTDEYMTAVIEERFEDALSQGQLLFNYTTTIQNHMSYTADKYGEDYVYPPVETSAALSPETRTMLEVYIEGVRDADAMLGALAGYFDGASAPVLLVFWGDHLPHLGENHLGYSELGIDVAGANPSLRTFEVPYLIYANDAAAKALDWDQAVADLDLSAEGELSASFLGQLVLELTGRGEESPWFRFLGEVRRSLPVVQHPLYLLPDGSLAESLDEEQQALIEKWRRWSYYKLEQKELR